MISFSTISTLIVESYFCSNSPLGPVTLNTELSTVAVTPSGIVIGEFPILDIIDYSLVNSTKDLSADI